jgi:hypothetical protein
MGRWVVRFWAVVFIVLSVSPFTAPFSTCDLTHVHSADEGAMGAVVAARTTVDHAPAFVATFFLLMPCRRVVPGRSLVAEDHDARPRPAPTVLRL